MKLQKSLPSQWITDAWIITQDADRRVLFGCIEIRDGTIVRITRSLPEAVRRASKGRISVVSAKGAVLIPGFVQAHVHLCQTLFRNWADDLELLDWLKERIWPFEAAHTYESLYISSLLGIHELLAGGTTCVLDMGTVRHTEAILEAVTQTGIRASVGKCLMDHPDQVPAGLLEATRVALSEADSLFRTHHRTAGDRLRISYAPRFVISCTERLLQEVARRARDPEVRVHTHASENLKEVQLVKAMVGAENVEYLQQLGLASSQLVLAHCIWLKPHEMELLARSKTHVAHCPSSNLKLASGIARVPEMIARGINVALGADGAPCNNRLSAFEEMRLAALLHKPGSGPRTLRAQEALDLATLNGASALGWSDKIGSIEVGKRADFALIDLNRVQSWVPHIPKPQPDQIIASLVYSASADQVLRTYIDGKIVFDRMRGQPRHPQFPFSTAELLIRAARAQESLARRVGWKSRSK